MITKWFDRYTDFFDVIDLKKNFVDKFDDPTISPDIDISTRDGQMTYVATMILRITLQMLANAFAVTRIMTVSTGAEDTEINFDDEEQIRIAAGVYSSASMMNHSCDPSVLHT